jgi:hypothetical protein
MVMTMWGNLMKGIFSLAFLIRYLVLPTKSRQRRAFLLQGLSGFSCIAGNKTGN